MDEKEKKKEAMNRFEKIMMGMTERELENLLLDLEYGEKTENRSIIGSGRAGIVEEPDKKLNALAAVMRHQTGKEFEEFEKNPGLEKAVTIIRVDVERYTCKRH